MSQPNKLDCDRDLKATPATTTVSFTYLDTSYELHLCEKHAADFDREMSGWTRVAREVENGSSFFDTDAVEAWRETLTREDQHRREVVGAPTPIRGKLLLHHGEDTDDEVFGRVPTYKQWTLTPHALERADERGFTRDECVEAAVAPEKVFLDHHPDRRRHQRGRVCVIVNVHRKAVLSVMFRHREDWVEYDRRIALEKMELQHA